MHARTAFLVTGLSKPHIRDHSGNPECTGNKVLKQHEFTALKESWIFPLVCLQSPVSTISSFGAI